jgi:hypothetical protein
LSEWKVPRFPGYVKKCLVVTKTQGQTAIAYFAFKKVL